METLRRIFEQFSALSRGMSAGQRATLIVVPLLVIGAFATMMFSGSMKSMDAVLYGKQFTYKEIMRAEQTFDQEGLNDYERKGRMLMVPSSQVEKYNTALAQAGSLPSDWTEEWAAQFEKIGVFHSRSQIEENRKIVRAKIIRDMLVRSEDIEEAIVTWAESKSRSRFRQGPSVTGTVLVTPAIGHDLSRHRLGTIRNIVASAVPDLKSTDVVVTDSRTGQSMSMDDLNNPYDDQRLERIRQVQQNYREKILQVLQHIKNVQVAVAVELDETQKSVSQEMKFTKDAGTTRSIETKSELTKVSRPASGEGGVQANRPPGALNASNTGNQTTGKDTETITESLPSRVWNHTETAPGLVKEVRVSVTVPREYYLSIAANKGLTPGETDEEKTAFQAQLDQIEADQETEVTSLVSTLLPTKPQNPADVINVTSVIGADATPAPVDPPMTETVSQIVSEWGGAIALTIFALWALRMLNKSMPKVPDTPAEIVPPQMPMFNMDDVTSNDEAESFQEMSERDRMQMLIRQNPETAATIIGKWISSAT